MVNFLEWDFVYFYKFVGREKHLSSFIPKSEK